MPLTADDRVRESMEPSLKNGDLVLALKNTSYAAGDVVAYRIPEGEPGAGALGQRTRTRGPGYARDVYSLGVRFPTLMQDPPRR